jgi:hypothetical protein
MGSDQGNTIKYNRHDLISSLNTLWMQLVHGYEAGQLLNAKICQNGLIEHAS